MKSSEYAAAAGSVTESSKYCAVAVVIKEVVKQKTYINYL